jgi:hypothetical protein
MFSSHVFIELVLPINHFFTLAKFLICDLIFKISILQFIDCQKDVNIENIHCSFTLVFSVSS